MVAVKSPGIPTSKRGYARPGWDAAFLKALAQCGIVAWACRQAKIDRKTAYNRRDKDEAFAEAWDEAIEFASDDLEAECIIRAKAGSDRLLMFMLKALKPEKYREARAVAPPFPGQDDQVEMHPDVAAAMIRAAVAAGDELERGRIEDHTIGAMEDAARAEIRRLKAERPGEGR